MLTLARGERWELLGFDRWLDVLGDGSESGEDAEETLKISLQSRSRS
jgi:hypothetical protein